MNIDQIKSSLQDLIIRLQDAEKGYLEISKATSNIEFKNWLEKYANERHQYHRALEMHSKALGGNPEVKTSFLGSLHRIFIDIKLNAIDDDITDVIDEIERGSNVLIEDYDKVINEVKLPENIASTILEQRTKIKEEIEGLKAHKNIVEAVVA